jgi:signal transduction histidine kinase
VVAEYNLLRTAFITVADRHNLYLVGEAARIINHRIDEAVRLSVMAFAAQEALKRKRQQDEHLAFVAHDLRTPLNAISLIAEELREGLPPETLGSNAELFDTLTRNLDRLERLIRRVVETDALPVRGTSFQPECRAFELWPLVRRLLLDFRPVTTKEKITVMNQISPALEVWGDAGLVSQVFQNLLGNAFKYAAGGRITVGATLAGGEVTCVVRDDGSGIPAELLPRVFDKLATDPAKDGSGLGLAIVKQIVDAHGGTVSAESEPGKGAIFRFTLPTAG